MSEASDRSKMSDEELAKFWSKPGPGQQTLPITVASEVTDDAEFMERLFRAQMKAIRESGNDANE